MADIIKSAFSQYENIVSETNAGNTGIAGRLKSKLDSSTLIKALNSNISKMNELASSLMGSVPSLLGLSNLFSSSGGTAFSNALETMAKTQLGKLADISDSTLNSLKNAGITYVGNILNDFVSNISACIYIPDKIFATSIKGLYYAGADLAYNKHYLRKEALKNDWNYTLEFIDEQYGITYSVNYASLASDIRTCAINGCWKNLDYIFSKLYIQWKTLNSDITDIDSKLKAYDSYKIPKDANYNSLSKTLEEYKKYESTIRNLMVEGTKNLIVNSYSYLTSGDLKNLIFKYKEIVKPKYFGTTDDLYNKRYIITKGECESTMMPYFVVHKTSKVDRHVNELITDEANEMTKRANTIDKNAQADVNEANILYRDAEKYYRDDEELYNKAKAAKRNAETAEKIQKHRSDALRTQASRSKTLAPTAVKRGSKGVFKDSRARYPMQNASKDTVKYRGGLNKLTEDMFDDKNKYIEPRNKNIKQIYIMLSSEEFWYEDAMVNEDFYNRCKYPTMTTLRAAADKAKGIMGSSWLMQAAYDLSDAIDGSAYNYLKKVKKSLFDPRVNTEADFESLVSATFSLDRETGELVLPESERDQFQSIFGPDITNTVISKRSTTDEDQRDLVSLESLMSDKTVGSSNAASVSKVDTILNQRESIKYDLAADLKYLNNLSMVMKRDLIVKYLTMFYELCGDVEISKTVYDKAFENLCNFIFNKLGLKKPDDLLSQALYNSTDDSLNNNIKVILGIARCEIVPDAMKLNIDDQFTEAIEDVYTIVTDLFDSELQSTGLIETLYKYDREHLNSVVKKLFYDKIEYLKSIADKNNNLFPSFYAIKDEMTNRFVGYDRHGILGYSDEDKRLQYTNIVTGDWKSIAVSNYGTFACGSENTKNNGIVKLNESVNEFEKTNIVDGNWTEIISASNGLFFVNADNTLYYWNGFKVLPTIITDFDKWEPYNDESNGVFCLRGKVDNGLVVWTGTGFKTITNSGSGWIYKVLQCSERLIHIAYPTSDPGNICIGFNPNELRAKTELTGTYNGFIIKTFNAYFNWSEEVIVGYNQDGSPITETVYKSDQRIQDCIFFGTDNGMYYIQITGSQFLNPSITIKKMSSSIQREIDRLVEEAKAEAQAQNKETVLFNGVEIPVDSVASQPIPVYVMNYNDADTIGYIAGRRKYVGRLELNHHYYFNPAIGYQPLSEGDLYASSGSPVVTYNTRMIRFKSVYPFTLADFEDGTRIARNEKDPSLLDLVNCSSDKSLTFFSSSDETKLLAKSPDNYYYLDGNGDLISMFSDPNDISSGWNLEEVDGQYFFVNTFKSMGIRPVLNYKTIKSSLNTGCWKMAYSNDYFFALSINGTDRGIMCCEKNITSNDCRFMELPDVIKNNGDYYGWAYDKNRKHTYFTSYRDNLVEDLNKVDYDIDEFIFLNDEDTIRKIIIDMNGKISDALAMGLSTNFTKDKLKSLIASIKTEVSKIKTELTSYEEGSKFFTNLVTADMAKREFNITDPKDTSSVLLEMINNSAFGYGGESGGNGGSDSDLDLQLKRQNAYMAKIIYQAKRRNLYVKHHFDPDANGVLVMIPNESVQNHEAKWYLKHSTISNDYLNSDAEGAIY